MTITVQVTQQVGIRFENDSITVWIVGSSPVWTIYGADGITYHTNADNEVVEVVFHNVSTLLQSPVPFYGVKFLGVVREEAPGDRVEEYLREPDLDEVYGG